MPSFLMSNGVNAEYNPGSYHVLHQGTTYLNREDKTYKPITLTDNTVGSVEKGQLAVQVHLKKEHFMPKAKTISIKFTDGSTASYLEGSVELSYNGDKYLLMDATPIFSSRFPTLETTGTIKGTSIDVFISNGIRGRQHFSKFEKEEEESSKKRKRLDLDSEERYTHALKKALVMEKKAPAALELAQKALKSVKELISLEKETRNEVGVKDKETVFVENDKQLETAVTALSHVIRRAGVDTADESDDE
jgi:hypothetical protein